ncbi:hypothetical protein TorRG33x02_052250 [Trema orientale]|uniref:Uncharacterized protein n=1 Tax=Trema orientale TaxID=63057 RepID=A0A2P5FMG4_TREOI|nr:hypothetical protein TorRG33x02_052250 [Trema orientale]
MNNILNLIKSTPVSAAHLSLCNHADLRENPNGEDDNPGGRVLRHHRQCQGQDSGQGGHPTGPAASHLRREAARGRPNPSRLQHPEGVDSAPGAPAQGRSQEEEEEDLHQAQKDQAQEEEGQARRAPVLQGR